MELKYHIGGDGDFRALDQMVAKVNAVQTSQEAVARLNQALAQREFDRLSTHDKIVRLREQELKLVNEAFRQQALGNAGAAANASLAALRLREAGERLVTVEKRQQAQLDQQAARDAQRMVDFAERARRERQRAQLRSGPAAGTGGGFGLGDLASGFGVPLGAGAIIATVTASFREMLGMVGRIKDNAEQLALTVTEVQQLGNVARDQGQDVGSFGLALSQLGMTRREAAEGNEELRASFERFGISLAQLNDPSLRNIDLLKRMAAATRDLSDADRERLRGLLGKGGDKLAGAVAGLGAAGGADVLAPEEVGRVDQAGKAFGKFGRGAMNWGARAYAATLDVFQPYFDIGTANYRGQREPGQYKSTMDRDQAGYRLDSLAIHEGRLTAEQAGPGYQRYAAFQKAQAERPDLRLDYDTWQRTHGPQPAGLHRDKVAEAAADAARSKELEAGAMELANTQRRHDLEMSMKSIAEQRADLARRRSLIELQLAETNDRREKAQLEAGLLEIDQRLAGLKDDPDASGGGAGGYRVSTSALQRIGGFTGGFGGYDPVQTRLDAIAAAAAGNMQASRQLLTRIEGGIGVHFQ